MYIVFIADTYDVNFIHTLVTLQCFLFYLRQWLSRGQLNPSDVFGELTLYWKYYDYREEKKKQKFTIQVKYCW